MKTRLRLLALAALLALPAGARAQSVPSYRSFSTNDFYTNGSSPIKINLRTNFAGIVITNIYSSNIFATNLYVTNLYVSNIISSDLIWTNAGPWIAPMTFTNALYITTNGTIALGRGVSYWAPGTSDALTAIHDTSQGDFWRTEIFMGALDSVASPTNISYFHVRTDTDATPASLLELSSTVSGINPSYFQINLQPDTATANLRLYNQGTLAFAVDDASGYSGTGTNFLSDDGTYKAGIGATINPTDGFIPYRSNATTFADSPIYRYDANTIVVDTIDANTIAATNLQSGGVVVSGANGILTNLFSGFGVLTNNGVSTNLGWTPISAISDGTNTAVVQLGPFTPGRYPIANGTNTLTDGSFYASATTNVALDVPLVWGPGTTNVLFSEGRTLVWTNSATGGQNVGFVARDGSGNEAQFIVSGATATVKAGTSGNSVDLSDGTRSVRWGSSYLSPLATGMGLGLVGGGFYPWQDINSKGTTRIYGFEDITTGGTNYARLAISHTGTNGAIVLDSQSAGTAGAANPYNFRVGGTNTVLLRQVAGQPSLLLTNSAGVSLDLTMNGGGNPFIDSSSGVIYIGDQLVLLGSLAPSGSAVDAGSVTTAGQSFRGVSATNHYTLGHLTGTGAAYLQTSHSGTNSSDRILFNSVSTGTAGTVGRPFAFTNAPIVLPTFTKAQKATLTTQEGMILFQTDNTPGIRVYQSGAWVMVSTVADP